MAHLRGDEKTRYIGRMFGRISRRYDLLNSFLSLGMHQVWRRQLAELATNDLEGIALDLGTGTGDMAMALAKQSGINHVVGLDLSSQMILLAQKKGTQRQFSSSLTWLQGDAMQLPLKDGAFACATMGWGLRNMASITSALQEMVRVVRPGGRVGVLDLTPLQTSPPLKFLAKWYMKEVVPFLGAFLGGNREAYAYLPESLEYFPGAIELQSLMRQCGLINVVYRLSGFGTHAVHVGRVPRRF